MTLMQSVERLRDQGILPTIGTVSIKDLNRQFKPVPSGLMLASHLKDT